MSVLKTVNPQEDFLMQINGDYNVPFDQILVTVAGALPAGTVLKDAATAAVDADTAVLGILAQDKAAGSVWMRVMVRGNPSTVNAQALSVKSATIITALAAKDILVENV